MDSNYSNLVSGFTKLFSTIVHSTVWREAMHVKVVWVTMLALADRNGRVMASLPGLADAARVSIPQCEEALKKLSSPDLYSRTKAFEGRRIAETDGGWQLLNYQKYREMKHLDERRIQTREAVRRHRELKRSKPLTVSHGKPKKAQAEAEAEAEAQRIHPSTPSTPPVGERGVGREGPLSNPLIGPGDRVRLETEVLRLVRRKAEITGQDAVDVMAVASGYDGARRTKLNPASMTDDRLLNTLRDLRQDVAELEGRHGARRPK